MCCALICGDFRRRVPDYTSGSQIPSEKVIQIRQALTSIFSHLSVDHHLNNILQYWCCLFKVRSRERLMYYWIDPSFDRIFEKSTEKKPTLVSPTIKVLPTSFGSSIFMISPMESLQRNSDVEHEQLMSSHDWNDEKRADSDRLTFSGKKQWKSVTFSGLGTIIASTALMSMLLSGLALHFLHILSPTSENYLPLPGTRFGSCGDSPSSARHANCTFDIMSFSWLPAACDDAELTMEFSRVREWTWWLDTNRTTTIPFEEVALGFHHKLFVTREYHMFHCTYMWRKLHRGLLKAQENDEKRGIVDSYIGSYDHTSHCEMMLIGMGEDGREINKSVTDTAILLKFPQCVWI